MHLFEVYSNSIVCVCIKYKVQDYIIKLLKCVFLCIAQRRICRHFGISKSTDPWNPAMLFLCRLRSVHAMECVRGRHVCEVCVWASLYLLEKSYRFLSLTCPNVNQNIHKLKHKTSKWIMFASVMAFLHFFFFFFLRSSFNLNTCILCNVSDHCGFTDYIYVWTFFAFFTNE